MTAHRPYGLATALAAVLVVGSVQAIGAVPAEYTFLDLGTFGGTKSQAFGLNNLGQVAGFAKDAAGNNIAFRTSPNSAINPSTDNLGPLAPGYASFAYALNDSGQVVGQSGTPAGDRAWQYSAGSMTNLGTLGGDWSYAYAVNATGQVTGGAAKTPKANTYPTAAFLYSGGTMYELGTLGGTEAYGQSINSGGTVVGYSDLALAPGGYAPRHAFLWRPTTPNGTTGTMTDLGTLGGLESYAYGINAAGQVVGGSNTASDAAYHAFLRTAGPTPAMLDLGTLGGNDSEAKSVNANGQIVGWADAPDGTPAAFVYAGGRMRNLNDLAAPAAAGWALSHAEAVNDVGQIAGYGVAPDGQTRGFLLSPIPTWAVNADATWSNPANWSTPAAPNAPAATANLASVITAPRTITLDAPVTLGQLNLAAASAYTVSGPGTLTLDGGPKTVRVYQGTHEIAVPLNLGAGGASILLDDAAGLKLSATVTGTLATLSLGTGARLDLANGSPLTLANSGANLSNVVTWLAAGYNGGDWNGAGITSTPVAQDSQRLLALGWRDDATAITILPTRFGDANLDGRVNADDYALLDRGMASGLAGWTNGDFNYDGSVTPADYLLIDRSFALQTGSLTPDLLTAREAQFGRGYVDELIASVPEPSAGAAALCLVAALAGRSRLRSPFRPV